MAETKAAMLTIKGRDSAMGAALKRPTSRIRGKDSGWKARGEVTRNRKGTMLGREVKITNSSRIMGAIIGNKETDTFLGRKAAKIAKKLGLVGSRSTSTTITLHIKFTRGEDGRMIRDAINIMGTTIKAKVGGSLSREIDSRLMGLTDRINSANKVSGEFRFDSIKIVTIRIKIVRIERMRGTGKRKTMSVEIRRTVGKINLIKMDGRHRGR